MKTKQLGSLAFNNTIRSNDGKGKFFNRITAPKKDRFWLELKTPLNFVNPILIGYVSGATDAFELDYDAPLMVEGADSFYSILGADKLAIQGKKYPMDLNDAIPLGATFYETGTHTISLVNKDGVFTTGQPIYLHDKLLNLYTDLQKQDYVFIADKGETKDRFEITYQPESTLSISNLEKEKVKIYYQEKDIVIEAYKTINEILIYDVSGKLIKSIKPKSKQLLIENSVLSNGVNVISIIFANEKINTKVISR